jgi:putative transposase
LRDFTVIVNPKNPEKKAFRGSRKITASVEYKTLGWSLHPTKRRITFTDKKGINEVKFLGR